MRGRPCLWHRHLRRLLRGCERLALPPVDADALTADVQKACIGHIQGVLKIILSAGHVERGYQRIAPVMPHYYLHVTSWPDTPLYHPNTEIQLQLCQTRLGSQPLLSGIKHLNRLEQVLARAELSPGIAEGVMLNQQGEVVEGIMSNLMIRWDGRYITPPIRDCGVAGVVRALLIEQAAQSDQVLEISTVTLEMLMQADAVYLMNSLLGIRQVAAFENHQYPQIPVSTLVRKVSERCFRV